MVCAVTHLVHEEGIGNDRRGGETLQCRKARFAALDPDSYGQVLEDRLSQVTDDLGVQGSQLPRELVCAGVPHTALRFGRRYSRGGEVDGEGHDRTVDTEVTSRVL